MKIFFLQIGNVAAIPIDDTYRNCDQVCVNAHDIQILLALLLTTAGCGRSDSTLTLSGFSPEEGEGEGLVSPVRRGRVCDDGTWAEIVAREKSRIRIDLFMAVTFSNVLLCGSAPLREDCCTGK
jgi:hypothetical protein